MREECTECDGRGYYSYDLAFSESNFDGDTGCERCEECNGNGYVCEEQVQASISTHEQLYLLEGQK